MSDPRVDACNKIKWFEAPNSGNFFPKTLKMFDPTAERSVRRYWSDELGAKWTQRCVESEEMRVATEDFDEAAQEWLDKHIEEIAHDNQFQTCREMVTDTMPGQENSHPEFEKDHYVTDCNDDQLNAIAEHCCTLDADSDAQMNEHVYWTCAYNFIFDTDEWELNYYGIALASNC